MAAKNIIASPLVTFERPVFQMFMGEMILSQASVVRYYDTSNRLNSLTGTLYITNFKLAFICSLKSVSKQTSGFSEKYLEEPIDHNDLIPLTVISNIYGISNMKQKRKKLKNVMIELSSQCDILEIETKDFRIVQYDFKSSGSQNKRSCFQMISHYAFPTTVFRLFAFDYGNSYVTSNSSAFCFFKTKKDYELNISRLHASQNWRVTDINEKFAIDESLPKFIVCPASLEDNDIEQIAKSYVKKRFPVWVWSNPSSGCSLLISSHLRNSSSKDPMSHQMIPSKLLNSLKSSSIVGNGESFSIDLNNISDFPSLKQLQISYQKIHKYCTFHSSKEFWSSDSSWLTSIEETGWLHYVSSCLKIAKSLAKKFKKTI